jgi:hypothetical protein
MKRVLSFLIITTAAFLAIAANRDDFERLSDEAAEKYTLPKHVGSEYATKFSDWSTEPMLHAQDVCGSHPFSNQYCDIIAVVAADGHVRSLLFSPSNPYVDCVRKNLGLGSVAPTPPGDSWPVQIRLIDGLRPKPKPSDKPFIILSPGHVE